MNATCYPVFSAVKNGKFKPAPRYTLENFGFCDAFVFLALHLSFVAAILRLPLTVI
jgi:hypothetical protein